ncbi:multifunctional oxoglutarate decarboxylase/oxoglutarate dehydrogenase thiamine pyrophosphate-binding subunit/dihydrolipoyllysine-residue succinyltransferase subunit [Corynebacterium variabile]|uniref:multifunctional oxoglutarate decarboxylase/oxoglutarate dehydrogenase thiamine pyrophosphate-binding subunit/dihydrolipoyllysine-residue succinyltransferase subunit n=2 Tax=Corynebacterium variabile TaxID=1727 RepID=UPI0028965753|nr:multifunctional oxoglutarate decarboxylase/oxoglutarate dehydrogenase thiamine pyrophosphate-binding subunit/dihydrolipoyllysine-residue succinyltransferase subunit [Corynebacterium variabile]
MRRGPAVNSSNFGSNEWLVDQMYQQFKEDPQSVDKEWRDFFSEGKTTGEATPAAAPKDTTVTAQATTPAAAPVTTPKTAPAGVPSTPAAGRPVSAAASISGNVAPSANPIPTRVAPPAPKGAAEPLTAGEANLKGAQRAIAKNMDASLTIPTATTVRDMPAKLMFENRAMVNDHLRSQGRGKISFTHILGWALINAVKAHPTMNNSYKVIDGKPAVVTPEHINLGLAIDLVSKNGGRNLVVAAIRECETLTFEGFVDAYEDIVVRARQGKLTMDDFSGVTIQLTNPGGIGTRHSVPRLTNGQGAIIGVGAMDYPAEFAGASQDRLADLGVGKLVTVTSTYDHRIIQGAESGEFLRDMSRQLIDDGFWDEIFLSLRIPYAPTRWSQDMPDSGVDKSTRVMQLIESYRSRGHLIADVNPLHWAQPGLPVPDHSDLDIESHGLTLWDLDRKFNVGGFAGRETMTLREVLATLRQAYTLKVGSEYTHILDKDERLWLQEHIEAGQQKLSNPEQKYLLQKLNSAEAFENFLQTKYIGQKRFSLEGAEALIPMLDAAADQAAEQGLEEIVIGMPHRGRLNVLANIVGKPYSTIFGEFEGNIEPAAAGGSGDVKYHLGAEGVYTQMFGDNDIKVTLTANPSHLEAVNPVMEGLARAHQDLSPNAEQRPIMPILMHGDAAFTGLGIVQETINMAQLRGYTVGGTVHVVVNNQIGFTTTPDRGRSTHYATDIAKGFDAPVFHVNGDDPEAVVWVARLAVEYRRRFGKDVFIDMVCYRRRGHNESDDPSMTQPELYSIIEDRPTVRSIYHDTLVGRGDITAEDAQRAADDFHGQLEAVFNQVKEGITGATPAAQTGIAGGQALTTGLDTSITADVIAEIGDSFSVDAPEGFNIHQRVRSVVKRRHQMSREGKIDWAFGELLAFGSLAREGRLVRLAGEDSQRGTFTQRHAILFDSETNQPFSPLEEVARKAGNGGSFRAFNSPLTEYAGMGFEYGYSVGNLDAVVAWEAQFGDFADGAQTIIDEYISSGEAKWGQLSSVILLLPHGYEGQGPDHSSARIERYLQMAAEGSMTIAQPSTPANHFHLLRRHALGTMRRPLVVFTPKSMLRNKAATSTVEDFTKVTKFQSVLDDPRFADGTADRSGVKKVLMCTGKIYYDLEKKRAEEGRDDVAIVRVEMLHPIPHNRIRETVAEGYPGAEVRWVQDEPANQGAWPFLALNLPERIPGFTMKRVSRRAQSSTATGVAKVHHLEQEALLNEAFAD